MKFHARQWEYLSKTWHLTPREIDVAKLVCMGLEDEQIAKKIRIKYNTVRTHLGNMCNKVGTRGKSGLILTFIEVLGRAKI